MWGLRWAQGSRGMCRGVGFGTEHSRTLPAQELGATHFLLGWAWGLPGLRYCGGIAGPLPTSLLGGLPAGIEMEIVNSCEAENGGCSHGCSHSSAGPLCTCPRGYELDEDQKTCIGAQRRRPARGPPPPGRASA